MAEHVGPKGESTHSFVAEAQPQKSQLNSSKDIRLEFHMPPPAIIVKEPEVMSAPPKLEKVASLSILP